MNQGGKAMHILICTIDDRQYGFDLTVVERSILASEITPIPQAPDSVLGAINMHGQIIPVINLRSLLGLPPREIALNDHFVICREGTKTIALWVDRVKLVRSCTEEEFIPARDIMADLDIIRCALKDGDNITLIFDLEKLIPGSIVAFNR